MPLLSSTGECGRDALRRIDEGQILYGVAGRLTEVNPHWRGAHWADCLDVLVDSDSNLEVTPPTIRPRPDTEMNRPVLTKRERSVTTINRTGLPHMAELFDEELLDIAHPNEPHMVLGGRYGLPANSIAAIRRGLQANGYFAAPAVHAPRDKYGYDLTTGQLPRGPADVGQADHVSRPSCSSGPPSTAGRQPRWSPRICACAPSAPCST
jgi:hypothetical protein